MTQSQSSNVVSLTTAQFPSGQPRSAAAETDAAQKSELLPDAVLFLVQIDLSLADHRIFDVYEASALPLLKQYGGRLIERLQSADRCSEFHLLAFPDASALNAFRTDPVRASLQDMWKACGATSTLTEVARRGQNI